MEDELQEILDKIDRIAEEETEEEAVRRLRRELDEWGT